MTLTEFYPEIRSTHIIAVLVSGALFLVRGTALQAGARWVMAPILRYGSYAIDTVLLGSAVLLCLILHQYPFVHGWLTAKVILLILYIVLGTLALRRGRTPGMRLGCFLAALLVYLYIISIARAHHPLGALLRFGF